MVSMLFCSSNRSSRKQEKQSPSSEWDHWETAEPEPEPRPRPSKFAGKKKDAKLVDVGVEKASDPWDILNEKWVNPLSTLSMWC